MTRIVTAALTLVLAGMTHLADPATAQAPPPELKNDLIDIEYNAPKNEKFRPIYERMKERKVLERFAAFLSPLKLQSGLTLSLEEGDPRTCGAPNSYYDRHGKLHLCYSWFYFLENDVGVEHKREPNEPFTTASLGLIPGFTRGEVIVGGTISLMLHEMGHALFDIQGIPLFGREEDAADQVAALIMLQFGPKVALTTIKGEYNTSHHLHAERLRKQKGQIQPYQEADEHSIDIQRAFNVLCIAYGKDPASFEELADRLLPRARKQNCADEYQQAALAFRKTVLPDVDPELLQQVLKMEVLRPEDFERVGR